MSSVSSAGTGQPIPHACARRRLSWIVLRATPNVRPISRALTPSWCSRNMYRSCRHGQLSLRRHPSLLVVIEERLVA
jgi:hypothetical protein